MKYVVLLVVLFSGCNAWMDADLQSKAAGHELYYIEIPNAENDIKTFWDIACWIRNNVEYIEDANADTWENPEVTYNRGYGDCDDMAILFMNIAYFRFGIKCDFAAVDGNKISIPDLDTRKQYTIVDGGRVTHALVYYAGNYYDPLFGLVNCEKVGYTYSFDEVFNG